MARRARRPALRRPWWRRVLRWLGLTVVGLTTAVLLLVGVVLVLLHTDWGRALGVRIGLGLLNESIRGEVRVERLEGSVLGELAVVGVEVRDPDGALVASVGRVEVSWDPWALLDQRVAVHRARVVEPSFTLEDAEGRVGVARAFEPVTPGAPPSPEPSPWTVLVERAVIEHGAYATSAAQGALGARDIALDVAVWVGGEQVVWEGLELEAEVVGTPVGPVRILTSGRMGPEGLRVDALRAEALGARLRGRGWAGTLDRPRGDVSIDELHVDLGALRPLAPDLALQGTLDAVGRAHGGYDGATLDLSVVSTAGRLVAHAHALLAPGGMRWELEAALRDVAPARALAGAPALVGDADVRVRGKGDALKKGRASLALEVLRLEGAPAPPLPLTVAATLEGGRLRAFARSRGQGAERLDVRADAVLATPLVAPLVVSVGWDLRGVDLALVEALAGLPAGMSLAGQVESLTGDARALVPEAGPPAVDASLALVARDLRVGMPGAPEPVEVGRLGLRAAGAWAGEPVPTAAVELTVGGARGYEATLGRLRAKLQLGERAGEAHGRGVLALEDAGWDGRASVDRLTVPFDLLSPVDARRLPIGRLAVDARAPRFEGHGAAAITTDQVLTHVGRSDRTAGPLHVEQAVSGGIRVGSVGGRVAARKGGVTGAVRVDLDLGVAAARFGPRERLDRATVDARVRLKPGVPGLTAEGRVTAQGVRAGDFTVGRASAQVDATVGRGLPAVDATLHAEKVGLPQRTLEVVDARASLRGGVASVAATAADGQVSLSVDATAALPKGKKDPLRATLAALRLEGPTTGIDAEAPATVVLDPAGDIEVRGLVLRGLHELPGAVRIDGAWGRQRFDGHVLVEQVPVGRWIAAARELTGLDLPTLPDYDGTVSVDLTTAGPASEPSAYAKIRVQDGRAGAFDPLELDLEAWVDEGSARVVGGADWKGKSRVDLDVRLPLRVSAAPFGAAWVEGGTVSARVDVEGLDLADLRQWVPPPPSGAPLSGSFRGRVDVGGPREELRGTISVTALDVDLGPLRDAELRGQITLDQAGTHGTVVAARGGKGLVRTTLRLPVNLAGVAASDDPRARLVEGLTSDPFEVVLEVGDVRLAELPYTDALGRDVRRVVVGARLTLGGTLHEPRVEGALRARQLPVGAARGALDVELTTSADDLKADLRLATPGAQLVDGTIRVPHGVTELLGGGDPLALLRDPRLLVALTATDLDGPLVSELVPGAGAMLSNALFAPVAQASVVVRGAPEGPSVQALVMAATVGERVPPEQQGIARSISAAVEALPGGTRLVAMVDQGQDRGTLLATLGTGLGTASLVAPAPPPGAKAAPADPTIQGTIESRSFDMAGLSRLLPDVFGPSRGALTVDVSVSGTFGKPEVAGAVEAIFEELSVAALGLVRQDAVLRVDVGDGRILLKPIHWEEDGGTFDLSLELGVPALDPARMTLKGDVGIETFPLMQRGDMRATLTGGLALAGTLAAPSVKGDLTIDDALVNPQMGGRSLREIGPPVDVVYAAAWEVEAARNGAPVGAVAAPRTGTTLDLGVTIPPRALHIQSDIVDVFVEGDLKVASAGGATSIEGVVTVVEGSVELEGRRFVIEEDSRVVFGGGPTIDPSLQIKAEYDISDVDLTPIGLASDAGSNITVEVGGRASAPTLNLRSTPAMDETNIMSILVLGNPVGAGGPGAADAFEKGAVGAFVGLATGRFTRLVQSALSIDVLRVEGGEQSLADAKLTVGKRLTRDLLLMYQANLGAEEDENANEVRVDYRIIHGLHLETRFGDAGRGSLDLLYRWRY